MTARPLEAVPRTALTIEEAAASVGVSTSTFKRHCLPAVKSLKIGGCRVISVAELRRYADREAR